MARAAVRARESTILTLQRRVEVLDGQVEAGRAVVACLRERLTVGENERGEEGGLS